MNDFSQFAVEYACDVDGDVPPDFGAELKIDMASFPSGSAPLLVISSPCWMNKKKIRTFSVQIPIKFD